MQIFEKCNKKDKNKLFLRHFVNICPLLNILAYFAAKPIIHKKVYFYIGTLGPILYNLLSHY